MITAKLLSVKKSLRGLPENVLCLLLLIWALAAPPGAYASAANETEVFGAVYALHEMTPLSGVTVSLEPGMLASSPWRASMAGEDAENAPMLKCITGSDGGFIFSVLFPGTYLLRAQGAGIGLSQEHHVEVVSQGESLGPFPIHTISGGSIRGRVYNKNTGAGLADIYVRPYIEGARGRFQTMTNKDGDYVLENLPPGLCTLYLSCSFRQIYRDRKVCVRDNRAINAFDFSLDITGPENGIVSGRVVDCTGAPLTDATVIAQYSVLYRLRQNMARTDATGHFTMTDLYPDTPFTLAVLKDGYAFYFETMRPDSGEIGAITLHQEAVITGTVHDESGRPFENAMVNVWRGANRPKGHSQSLSVGHAMVFVSRNGMSSWTARDGSFRIGGLSAGEYQIEALFEPPISFYSSVSSVFWPDHAVAKASCDLVEGQTLYGLALSLKTADYLSSISGRVLNSDGRPVPGAGVRADNASYAGHTTADLDGAFTIRQLPHGAYWLNVYAGGYQFYTSWHHEGHPFERGRIKTGSEPVTLVLTESARLEGRVVNAETGAPIPVFQIGFGRERETPLDIDPGPLRTRLEPQGRFTLELNSHETHIVARAEGFTTTNQPLRIGAKEQPREIVVALSPTPDLEEELLIPKSGMCP